MIPGTLAVPMDATVAEAALDVAGRSAWRMWEFGMGKLSVSTLVTLDGVIQDPGGFGETEQGGWGNPYVTEGGHNSKLQLVGTKTLSSGAVILTYAPATAPAE